MNISSTSSVRATVSTGVALLVGASAALGTYFGYQSGSHHHVILGLIFGGAALGGELLKPFAMAGAFDAFKRWDVLKGLACMAVGLVCVVYSLASELALSAGSRGDLAAKREAVSDVVHAAKEKRQRAVDELAALKPARAVAEIETLIAASTNKWRKGCQVLVTNGNRQTVCPPNPILVAELARSKRRTDLEQAITAAEKDMRATGTVVKDADPLASAVAFYMTAAGWDTAADAVSPWLYLLPVLFLELCSAFGLVVASAVGSSENALSNKPVQSNPGHSTEHSIAEKPPTPKGPGGVHTVHSPAQSSRDRLLAMVRDANGALRTGHRALGKALGVSATRAGQLLKDLAADGAIRVRAGKTGSVVTLAPRLISERK